MAGNTIWTTRFWKAVAERAIKTAAQVLVVFLGADLLDVFSVNWERALGIGLGALLVSVLTSLASSTVSGGGPSITNDEVLARPLAGPAV
jgi:hypothetical protein